MAEDANSDQNRRESEKTDVHAAAKAAATIFEESPGAGETVEVLKDNPVTGGLVDEVDGKTADNLAGAMDRNLGDTAKNDSRMAGGLDSLQGLNDFGQNNNDGIEKLDDVLGQKGSNTNAINENVPKANKLGTQQSGFGNDANVHDKSENPHIPNNQGPNANLRHGNNNHQQMHNNAIGAGGNNKHGGATSSARDIFNNSSGKNHKTGDAQQNIKNQSGGSNKMGAANNSFQGTNGKLNKSSNSNPMKNPTQSDKPGAENQGGDVQDDKKQGLKENLEKEAAKKAAEVGLEAVGVPQPAAKKIVEEADKKGMVDQAVEMFKKKKKQILVQVLMSILPYILWGVFFGFLLLIIIMFIANVIIGINTTIKKVTGGSGELENFNYSVVDTFYPVYGSSSCTILEPYESLDHEYIVSKSTESGNVYSVTDGEIIYVNNKGVNLYDKYDFNTKKCMCNGSICDNYNGSEVKIKFEYDEIEYVVIYSNLATINVSVGDKVKKGDLIGTEGNTGCVNSKRLTFKVVSENGISYNTNEFLQICSNSGVSYNTCSFQNIKIDLLDCNENYLEKVDLYKYIKNKIYQNYSEYINNQELMKAMVIVETTKTLKNGDYHSGDINLRLKDCTYQETNISNEDSQMLDDVINKTINQVLTFNGELVIPRISNTCSRTEKDKNANSIYNELCINEAIKMAKKYEEILNIYYPNYNLSKDYCNDYAQKNSSYQIDNSKSYITSEYPDEYVNKLNNFLESKIKVSKYGSRAATVEAARFLSLGLKNKISFVNGGKYFEKGINKYWSSDGLDSSGFVSWALLNGGAKINRDLNIKELVSNNVTGSIKIDNEFYKYFDKIQVGDFAYKDSKIGIIIGKKDGIFYVAEANIDSGIIVTEIKSLGISDSDYTHIYFANDYYQETGNLTSMW